MAFELNQLHTAQLGWGGVISALGDMILSTAGAATISGSILPLTCGLNQVMDFGAEAYSRGSVRIHFKTGPSGLFALRAATATVKQGSMYPYGIPEAQSGVTLTRDSRGAFPTTFPGELYLELARTNFPTNRVRVVRVPLMLHDVKSVAPNGIVDIGPLDFTIEPEVFRYVRITKTEDRDLTAGLTFDIEIVAVP